MGAETDIRDAGQAGDYRPENPVMRAEIPADFSPVIAFNSNRNDLLKHLDMQLGKHGTSLRDVKRIHIAYPHKHPGLFPTHQNEGEFAAGDLQRVMKYVTPHITWTPLSALCETVHLQRSENQGAVHALTSKQIYEVHGAAQGGYFPLQGRKEGAEKEFFVIADSHIEQGTTIANLMSYITHNGGIVLAATQEWGDEVPLAQTISDRTAQERDPLGPVFGNLARNTGRLPELAKAFANSAAAEGFNWSPRECLEKFEKALNGCGNSVFAMTDGECERLAETVRGTSQKHAPQSFTQILTEVQRKARLPGLG